MKISKTFWVLPCILLACVGEDPKIPAATQHAAKHVAEIVAEVAVSNPSTFARPDTPINLSFNELGVMRKPLQVRQDDVSIPTRLLDVSGDGSPDHLVFLADLKAAGKEDYSIERQAIEPGQEAPEYDESLAERGDELRLADSQQALLPPRIRLKTKASRAAAILDPLEISTRLALSEIERRGDSLSYGGWDSVRGKNSNWTYTTGLLMEAIDDVSQATGSAEMAAYAKRTMDSYVTEDGLIHTYKADEFNIDHINSGKMLQRLYKKHGDQKYAAAIKTLARQLADHPRTSEGAFWHKKRYPHQLWLDGVYMGMPFLARVGVMQGDDHKIEEAVREFRIARSHLRDADTGLYYHAWDEAKQQEWADPETGRSKYFWGRGMGWYAMALVDVLDVIPANKTELRESLITNTRELADDLLKFQDDSGVWYQILDLPNEPGNYREASVSAMFTYFLAKAVNKEYLPGSYAVLARKAYNGLVDEFVAVYADGSFNLTNTCEVAGLGYGRDGSYRYYMSEKVVANDPKGLGPAILAGLQVAQLPE